MNTETRSPSADDSSTEVAAHPDPMLRCARPGRGTPLILVHAYPFDSRMWDEVIDALPADQGVFTLSVPGANTPAEESLDTFAATIGEAARAQGIDRAVWAGLSMGGYVLLALVAHAPELFAGLCLLNTRVGADAPAARENRLRIAAEVKEARSVESITGMANAVVGITTRETRPEIVEQLRTWIAQKSPESIHWAQRAMAARPDRSEAVAAFSGPMTVVVGDEDELTPREFAQAIHDLGADSRLVVVPGVGHLSAVEAPDVVARELVALIERAL